VWARVLSRFVLELGDARRVLCVGESKDERQDANADCWSPVARVAPPKTKNSKFDT
jgi:hypothetical protein